MRNLTSAPVATLAALALLTALPAPVHAQEACRATVMSARVAAGAPATQIAISLTQEIGPVSRFAPAEDSGVRLATASELSRVELASGQEPERPIRMGEASNRVTVGLSTVDAEAGTYDFSVIGPEGPCSGSITIEPRR